MIGPTEDFGGVIGVRSKGIVWLDAALLGEYGDQSAVGDAEAAKLGLECVDRDFCAEYLVFPSGPDRRGREFRTMHSVYVSSPPDAASVHEAIRMCIRHAHEKYGPGRYWTLMQNPHVICDDGRLPADDTDEGPRVRVRFFYVHEKQPPVDPRLPR